MTCFPSERLYSQDGSIFGRLSLLLLRISMTDIFSKIYILDSKVESEQFDSTGVLMDEVLKHQFSLFSFSQTESRIVAFPLPFPGVISLLKDSREHESYEGRDVKR